MDYAWKGLELGLSCFIEASVVEAERILELPQKIQGRPIVMAPSCTMRYFPGPRKVKEIMQSRSEEHTSELQSLMRISYAVFCLKKKQPQNDTNRQLSITIVRN